MISDHWMDMEIYSVEFIESQNNRKISKILIFPAWLTNDDIVDAISSDFQNVKLILRIDNFSEALMNRSALKKV